MLSEDEIGAATLDLARIGIYVEPTSAQAAAAFRKLLDAGAITPEQTTVLVLTGSGLKATPRIAELLGSGVVSSGSRPLPRPPPARGGGSGDERLANWRRLAWCWIAAS